jgi:hypothetical protein
VLKFCVNHLHLQGLKHISGLQKTNQNGKLSKGTEAKGRHCRKRNQGRSRGIGQQIPRLRIPDLEPKQFQVYNYQSYGKRYCQSPHFN